MSERLYRIRYSFLPTAFLICGKEGMVFLHNPSIQNNNYGQIQF